MNHRFNLELASARSRLLRQIQDRARPAAGSGKRRRHALGGDAAPLEALGAAVRAWRATPEGEAAVRGALAGDHDALKRALDQLVAESAFARLRADGALQLELDGLPFKPSCVSIGFCGMVDFGLGVYGCIGYAADLGDIYPTSSVALYAAGTLGADEGLDAGVQLGLWKDPVAKMPDWYWGVGLEVGFIGDMGVVGLAHDEDGEELAAVLVNIDGGENDGLEGLLFGAVTWGLTRYPMAQDPASHLLILQTLTCVNQSEGGHDEVYFLFQPDNGTTYRYPEWNYYAMTDDDKAPEHTWNTGRSVWFDSQVTVKVYDGGDLLSSMVFKLSDFSGVGSTYTYTPDATGGIDKVQYSMLAKLVQ